VEDLLPLQEYLIQFTEANMLEKRGDIFIEGIDVIIRRDLDKHGALLEKNQLDIQALQRARSNEIDRKRFYGDQKGKRKYRDDAMDIAIKQMNTNIAGLSVKIKQAEDMKVENTIIVDALSKQLKDYDLGIREMAKRKINGNSN